MAEPYVETGGTAGMAYPPPFDLSDEAKQQALDVGAALAPEVRHTSGSMGHINLSATGEQWEVAKTQWAFERSDMAESIQRTNDIQAPGE